MYGWWPVPISPRPRVQSRRSAIAQNRGRQRHSIISFHKASLLRMTNCGNESHHPAPYRIGTYLWYNWTVGTFQLATQNGALGRHVGASRAPSCSASLQVRFLATPHPQSGHRHGSPAQRPVQKVIRRGASATHKAPNSDPSPTICKTLYRECVDHMSMTRRLLLNAESWRTIFCPSTG